MTAPHRVAPLVAILLATRPEFNYPEGKGGLGRSHREPAARALAARLGQPRQLWVEARLRWDPPIEGTMGVRGPFNRLPRWPFQVGAGVRRLPEFSRTRRRRRGPSTPG